MTNGLRGKATATPVNSSRPGASVRRVRRRHGHGRCGAFGVQAQNPCRGAPVIDAGRELRTDVEDAGQLDAVVLEIHPRVLDVMGITEPTTGLQSKFSVYHCFAVGLMFDAAGPREFSDERAVDNAVQEVRRRVRVELDPSLPADSCRMTATLFTGAQIVRNIEHATGSAAAPMTSAQLEDNVTRLADRLDDPARLWSVAWHLDEVRNVSELFAAAAP